MLARVYWFDEQLFSRGGSMVKRKWILHPDRTFFSWGIATMVSSEVVLQSGISEAKAEVL